MRNVVVMIIFVFVSYILVAVNLITLPPVGFQFAFVLIIIIYLGAFLNLKSSLKQFLNKFGHGFVVPCCVC